MRVARACLFQCVRSDCFQPLSTEICRTLPLSVIDLSLWSLPLQAAQHLSSAAQYRDFRALRFGSTSSADDSDGKLAAVRTAVELLYRSSREYVELEPDNLKPAEASALCTLLLTKAALQPRKRVYLDSGLTHETLNSFVTLFQDPHCPVNYLALIPKDDDDKVCIPLQIWFTGC